MKIVQIIALPAGQVFKCDLRGLSVQTSLVGLMDDGQVHVLLVRDDGHFVTLKETLMASSCEESKS